MKERPIIFSTEMVNAIIEGKKTQTRRIIRKQPWYCEKTDTWHYDKTMSSMLPSRDPLYALSNPYGRIGDLLYVREKFRVIYGSDLKVEEIVYAAGYSGQDTDVLWSPSIFLPKCDARIFLEILDVGVERIQDISEEDSIAEGLDSKKSFQELWSTIHSQESWIENPWVWVLKFKVLSTTGKPN